MNRDLLLHLARRARTLPPRVVARKVVGLALRIVRSVARRAGARCLGSYSKSRDSLPGEPLLRIPADAIPGELAATLAPLAARYLEHRFDVLGSGWVENRHGIACEGFLGRSYPPGPPVAADRDGHWLGGRVNRSNLERSRQIWRLVDRPDYRPIDWQLDVKSGYRWSERDDFSRVPIPVDIGADIKLPWELARLQHLPQLALAAILSESGRAGYRPSVDYVAEIRSQILDFCATNPPRFGANWVSPMEVGIRIANVVLALDLLRGRGIELDAGFLRVAHAMADEHATHIAGHLEWSEIGRSNHYLSDLTGLAWAAAWLGPGPRNDAWLAFATRELVGEIEVQFLADGGCYEGSTSYHRLSGELAVFGLALVHGLPGVRRAALERYDHRAVRMRPPFPAGPLATFAAPDGQRSYAPRTLLERLWRAARFSEAVTRPDGTAMQVGDTDSGRLFKLHPIGIAGDPLLENTLDHRGFVEAADALLGYDSGEGVSGRLEGSVVHALGAPLAVEPVLATVVDHGDLDAVIRSIESLPQACWRRRVIGYPAGSDPRWQRHAFAQFGLYVFAAGDLFVAFRCAPAPSPSAPTGHTHDDNLAVEYDFGPAARCFDPGTYVYTPDRAERDRYRSAASHDVPRPRDFALAPAGSLLFDLHHRAWARRVAWLPDGVAGTVEAAEGTVWRALRLTGVALELWDAVSPPWVLAEPISPRGRCLGYGRGSDTSISIT